MGAARRFTVAERRTRLARRHNLFDQADDVAAATEAMVALHATDPASVYLSVLARLAEPSLDRVGAALYDDRSVVRVLAMRRTLFVVPTDALDIVERSSTDDVAANERKRLVGFLGDSGIDDPTAWLAEAAQEIEAALTEVGAEGAPARTITRMVPRLATKITMGAGTKHAGTAGATSRVLAVLANEGVLVRGRPAGRWTGRMYNWHLRSSWLASAPPSQGLSKAAASAELVRRWLLRFGPAPISDIKWWTGWTMGQVKAALAALDIAEVELIDGGDGVALADDLDDGEPVGPWAALLPSLDPTPMGWKERDWFLGPHQGPLFDRFGNIGPTVWLDGRIVGGWGQRPDGEIVPRLLEDVDTDCEALVATEVARLQAAIGDTVVKPSFPTPLQREMTEI